jgi:hypothetical protein
MKHRLKKFTLPIALATAGLATGIPIASSAFASGAASAPVTYTTTLGAQNGSGASGTVSIVVDGSQATVTEHVEGLAATFGQDPYPHVLHIHIAGKGECPTPSASTNGDGVVSTVEGLPAYGNIGASLTLSGDTSPAAGTALNVAPSGASFDYHRTFTLDGDTLASLKDGTAVVVVHGLDPSTLSEQAQGEMSELVPTLPLAATSPALCGVLSATAGAAPTTTAPPTTVPAPAMAPATPMAAQPTFTG